MVTEALWCEARLLPPYQRPETPLTPTPRRANASIIDLLLVRRSQSVASGAPPTDGGSVISSGSPTRSLSSASPPNTNMTNLNAAAGPMGGVRTTTPTTINADDDKSTAEFLRELQGEKESLEASSDENVAKTHTLKLLEQGKPQQQTRRFYVLKIKQCY